jgi:hypothetical protein
MSFVLGRFRAKIREKQSLNYLSVPSTDSWLDGG